MQYRTHFDFKTQTKQFGISRGKKKYLRFRMKRFSNAQKLSTYTSRRLPSFLSFLIRIFYITRTKFDEFLIEEGNLHEEISFKAVLSKFLLF